MNFVLSIALGAQKNGSFEHPLHMFWLRNKKLIFTYALLSTGIQYAKTILAFLSSILRKYRGRQHTGRVAEG